MGKFLRNLFGQSTKNIESQQFSSNDILKKYDAEYIRYCIEHEQVVSALEAGLRDSDDPKEIAMQTLKAACTFYGGDWAGILEVDLDFDVWEPIWWYNPGIQDRTTQLVLKYETAAIMPTWISAMKQGKNLVIPDVSVTKEECPDEYAVYRRLFIQSVIAAPFAPHPVGFLVIRNPSRYIDHTSMLNVFAYVLHRAMAQQKALESAKLMPTSEDIQNDKDIVVKFFGDMEICTSKGVLSERFFNSPKSSRVVTYLLLNPKTAHPPLEIYHTLWPEECIEPEVAGRNIRGYIYRFRQAFSLICDYPLIESTPNGYRINPNLNIITDVQQFDRLCEAMRQTVLSVQKVSFMKKALHLYRGPLFSGAQDEHWIISQVNLYRLRYVALVNELLSTLAATQDFACVQHYAIRAIDIMPGNLKAYYWLIVATYHLGAVELARTELNRAKLSLTSEEYSILVKTLKKAEGISIGELIK